MTAGIEYAVDPFVATFATVLQRPSPRSAAFTVAAFIYAVFYGIKKIQKRHRLCACQECH